MENFVSDLACVNNLEEKKKTNKYLEDIIEEFSGYKNDLIILNRLILCRL